jgi:hypothetical protein
MISLKSELPVTIILLQVELEDPVENIGAKLVRQAAAKTNDLAGDGTTTSVVLAQGLIAEGVKVCHYPLVEIIRYLYDSLFCKPKNLSAFFRLLQLVLILYKLLAVLRKQRKHLLRN